MQTLWLRIRPALMFLTLLTGVFILSGLVLYCFDPLLSLPHLLYRARYGLLAWRLCLYAACVVFGLSLYRRLPDTGKPRLIRVAGLVLLLLVAGELSNLLQRGTGV
ncbi:hypothetical protein [Klebsiella pneumoniae]|uniref:hypothetical protein n=1 Tax=Klebsiella pneumoniae TaxID=573 RepID=UPI00203B0195|nr:hypothetical protein [Klebsiella pneumoniae]USB67178.1 hypothetical protein KU669_10470 [Klebsiella pneumoniae]